MLNEFRELVRAGILRVTPENEVISVNEPMAESGEPGKEQPAGSRDEEAALLDRQLLEWLERRRRRKEESRRVGEPARLEPADTGPVSLRLKVVERLAQKILVIWGWAEASAEAPESLRDQVAERLADEILQRWQRGLE